MTPASEQTNYFKALEGLLEEYTAWYNDVTRATFYPQELDYNKISMRHDDFVLWARSVEAAGVVAAGSMSESEYGPLVNFWQPRQ
ncbi:MAG: hypothetical protein L6Q57_06990 [Alphaproteobacteria bacterium]|nr:hypothetical protein [Alphaproteobacteria bacterium]